ncbi:hypothetical protein BCR44DRAFT_78546 [Catenaria anguillulae PL171]|uniref:Uncharacterized protein n=1 Tax=Catenaria anguillulae PL171 TaxID=765915 RepID=A0A1Y2HPR7_9FUNG|nr:hypothetical protein BCR44DRAFT_78546 [Catenaria anguillulae PL171]
MSGLLAGLVRGKTRRSAASFIRQTPELVPLFSAVTAGLGYAFYKMWDKTVYDPHLRLRANQGVDPVSWQSKAQ